MFFIGYNVVQIDDTNIKLIELFEAYEDCRKNKRNTMNAIKFEMDYEANLSILLKEINTGTYQPGKSIAFIIDKPVQREIFAADFRDRIVHHLIIKKLNPLFERIFIHDSYACREGRGTHFGIKRADSFIRKCSQNYTTACHILKLDIQGFFMAINKRILWTELRAFITKYYLHSDKRLLLILCHKILNNNPTKNCIIKGNRNNWHNLPNNKSLFYSAPACGLPIGNLTSQIFANFYMNAFDHFVKHDLGIRYYGRYVDDCIIVHQNKNYLTSLIPIISDFLKSKLGLTIHPRKLYLQHYEKGVTFLGVTIKPHRICIGKRTSGNFYNAIAEHNAVACKGKPNKEEQTAFLSSMNSYLGIMKHYNTYRLRKKILIKNVSIWWKNLLYISGGYSKFVPLIKTVKKPKKKQKIIRR